MSCCQDNKVKYRCSGKTLAECTFYEGTLPSWSKLRTEPCIVLKETTDELYDEVSKLKTATELKGLASCITYNEADKGKVKVNEAIKKHSELLCELLGKTDGKDGSPDITRWGLDMKCLVDGCNNPPSTLAQLLQLLINKACSA